MADLQRSLDIQPTVASVGGPIATPVESDIATAVSQVGDAVKTFVANKKKDRLTEELRSLGDDVFAVNTGKEVKRATDRLSRLKQAKEQGAISNTMVKIEAEAILKEEIDAMPAFGPELRRHAASVLGYDPTGSQIRALLDVPAPSSRNTVLDKMQQNAEAIAATTGADPAAVMKLQGNALFASQTADLIAQQAAIGNAGRREILSSTSKEADGHISQFMADLVSEVNAGGVAEPANVVAQLQARILGHKQGLRDRYNAANITPDAGELSKDMAIIDEQWSPLLTMAREGSLANIMATNAKSLSNAMTIEGYNVMGDIALINEMAGQEGVKHYFLTLDKYSKKEQLDLLKANNPVLARNIETQDDAQKLAAKAYKRIFGTSPAFAEGEGEPGEKEMTDRVFYDSARDNSISEDQKQRRLTFAKSHGQRFKVLGGYFQSGGRSAASPEEVRFVTQTFDEEYPAMVERLAGEIAGKETWRVRVKDGRLEAYDPSAATAFKVGSPYMGVQVPDASQMATADLIRLNSFDNGIKNGWAIDLKQNPETFLRETAARINNTIDSVAVKQETLSSAIEMYETNPTPEAFEAIRKLDPQLAADVERLSGTSLPQSTGGRDNAE